jgi:hypothetical protein
MARNHKLLTKDKLQIDGLDKVCSLCREEDETLNHLFFSCSIISPIWLHMKGWLGLHRQMNTITSTVRWIRKAGKGKHVRFKLVAAAYFVYIIWESRNNMVFENRKISLVDIIRRVQTHACRFSQSL